MIRTLTSFIFLLTFFSGFSNLRGAAEFQQNLTGSEMNELIASYNIPGMAIAIISKDSTWIGTFGVADKNSRVQVTEHTIFRIGSISKSFLAIAINQLADEGKIDLNDPVKEILPDLYMPNQW